MRFSFSCQVINHGRHVPIPYKGELASAVGGWLRVPLFQLISFSLVILQLQNTEKFFFVFFFFCYLRRELNRQKSIIKNKKKKKKKNIFILFFSIVFKWRDSYRTTKKWWMDTSSSYFLMMMYQIIIMLPGWLPSRLLYIQQLLAMRVDGYVFLCWWRAKKKKRYHWVYILLFSGLRNGWLKIITITKKYEGNRRRVLSGEHTIIIIIIQRRCT